MSNPFQERLKHLTEKQRQILAGKLALPTEEQLVAHVIAPETDTDTASQTSGRAASAVHDSASHCQRRYFPKDCQWQS